MSTIEMYAPKFQVIDIFNALKKLKSDELLPEDGVFQFFYENSLYPGVSLFLRHKKRIKFFYIDHDNFILEIKEQSPQWNISADQNLVRISLLYKINGAEAQVNFVFDISDNSYRELIDVIRKNKVIKLYYMSMLYGGVVFDSYVKLKVPSEVIAVLKKIN